jgi:hypothetical protein
VGRPSGDQVPVRGSGPRGSVNRCEPPRGIGPYEGGEASHIVHPRLPPASVTERRFGGAQNNIALSGVNPLSSGNEERLGRQ